MEKNKDQKDFDFYEEVRNASNWQDDTHLETLDADHDGLSHENVRKLTDDLNNPLPPADQDH